MSSKRAQSLARNILDSVGGGDWASFCYGDAANAIDAAFLEVAREQRERDAKVAETSPPHVAHTYSSENAEQYRAFDDGQRFGANLIAAAIRNQKESEKG